jgi:hypothetical protein
MSMYVGEALAGEGNEVAHIDLLIGDKEEPVGAAFADALARQSHGHTNLLAVLTPDLAVKPTVDEMLAGQENACYPWAALEGCEVVIAAGAPGVMLLPAEILELGR